MAEEVGGLAAALEDEAAETIVHWIHDTYDPAPDRAATIELDSTRGTSLKPEPIGTGQIFNHK